MLVWVDAWQMQCCGEPFAIGDRVTWALNHEPDLDWLQAAVGPEVADRIQFAEDHHGALPDDHPVSRGSVVGIHAAYSLYAPVAGGGRTFHPVPGSAVLQETALADGNEDTESDEDFNGYVVELDLLPGAV